MSGNERAALDKANLTIGRQDWSSDGRMLGAGTGPSSNFSEIGLSANPRAMGHGINPMPMPQPAAAANTNMKQETSSNSSGGSSDTTAARDTNLRMRVAAAPGSVKSSGPAAAVGSTAKTQPILVPALPMQQQQQQQRQNLSQQQQQQQGGTSNQQASSSSSAAHEEPGKPKRAAPAGQQQQAWYAAAWHWFRSAVWGTPPDLMQLGPPWTKWPDYDRLNNTNALLAGLWPSLSEAVSQQLVLAMAPGLMQQATKDYGAGYLTDLKLVEFELGEIPPRLDGLKVYDDHVGDEQLMLEVAASWGSNSKVSIGATLQLFGHTFKIPLTIQKLQFHFLARISAQPMLTHYPYIGSVGVSLIEPPFVDFELPLGGVDVMALPMLRGVVRMATKLVSRQFVVFPRGIQVPLVPAGAAAGGPCGMLEVGLVRVAGLRSEDLIGHSDPYVIFRLREGREVRSRTVSNNNNPEFNQNFRMLVDDTETQVLQIIVMDEDLISMQDKVIGVAQVPLKTAACVAMPRTRVPISLNIHKLMAPQQGIGGLLELPIRVAGLPITAAATGGRMIYQNLAGALGISSKGSGSKGSHDGRYNEVLDETGWLGPSEEFWEEQGEYGRDAAASGRVDDGAESSSSSIDGDAAATPAAGVDSSTAVLVPTSDPAVAAALGSSSSSRSPFNQGQALKVTPPAGSTAAAAAAGYSSKPGHARRLSDDAAPHGKAGGLNRLASQSAPLSGYPEAPSSADPAASNAGSSSGVTAGQAAAAEAAAPIHTPEVRGPSAGPGKPAIGTQQQEQQQQKKKEEERQKEQKEQLQSMQGTATGKDAKGLEGTQVKPVRRGTAFLELTYTPFRQPEVQPSGAGASPAASLLAVGLGRPKPTDMGILAVTVVRAKGLTGWQHEADPYVTLGLMQTAGEDSSSNTPGAAARLSMVEEQRSKTVYNEESPRFNEKFDFIMIPASSVLLVTVWDQTTIVEAVVSLSVSRERFRDQVLGRVKVPVMDVAAAGRVRSSWPLQGAMMGELEMILQWIPQHLVE